MKKYLSMCLFFIISIIFLLIFDVEIKEELNYANKVFLFSYLPSILPFVLIINIFLKYTDLDKLYVFFKNKKLTFIFDIFIIFLCLISGIPGCGSVISYLVNNNIYSKEKGDSIIEHFSLISLPFIYSITSKNYLFIIILTIVSTICYLLTNIKTNTYQNIKDKLEIDVLSKSINSLTTIYFFLTLVVLLSIPLKLINFPFLYFFLGFLETSFPSIQLINNYPYLGIFIISFTSFSLTYQLKKTYPYLSISKYLKKRLLIASLVTLLLIIFS